MGLNSELLEKAKQACTAEEIVSLAKENGVELTEEEAKEYFEQLHKSGELSDEELDSVAGGGCHKKDGRLIVTAVYSCDGYICKDCDSTGNHKHSHTGMGGSPNVTFYPKKCNSCRHLSIEKGLYLCNNEINIK